MGLEVDLVNDHRPKWKWDLNYFAQISRRSYVKKIRDPGGLQYRTETNVLSHNNFLLNEGRMQVH